MIKSMTAYGRATKSTPIGEWVFEIHSVNRRMLDINLHAPKELLRYDIELRKWISAILSRGQITIRIHLVQGGQTSNLFQSQAKLLKELKAGWEKIAGELGFDPKQAVDLHFLTEQLPTFFTGDLLGDEKEVLEILKNLFNEAIAQVIQMKEREGIALAQDIRQRLKTIEDNLQEISSLSSGAVERYRLKLQEKIREICAASIEGDDRILREVAIYAERLDFTEELTRLKSHIHQFQLLLDSDEKSVGRTLDFLSQEMNREINTIASKASDSEVSRLTVNVKSELEKIREQIQNIE